jgi:orotidine-5'-phosphate decarboxylase
MMAAASEAASAASGSLGPRPLVVAVTVLTSLDDVDLKNVGQNGPAENQVLRLGRLARDAKLDGVVCSAQEAEPLRTALGPDFKLIVPGIRPAGSAVGDQKRVMGPSEAIRAGADFLVVGRPITEAADPIAAARAIIADIAAATAK